MGPRIWSVRLHYRKPMARQRLSRGWTESECAWQSAHPGVGVDAAAAARLRKAAENNEQIRMNVAGQIKDRTAESLIFDLPGTSQKWAAVSAHIDGHDLAQSAMDNASGLAVVLEMARLFALMEKRKLF